MLNKIEGAIIRFGQDTSIGDTSGNKNPDLSEPASGATTPVLTTGKSAVPRISIEQFGTHEIGTDENFGEFGHVWDTNFPPY